MHTLCCIVYDHQASLRPEAEAPFSHSNLDLCLPQLFTPCLYPSTHDDVVLTHLTILEFVLDDRLKRNASKFDILFLEYENWHSFPFSISR